MMRNLVNTNGNEVWLQRGIVKIAFSGTVKSTPNKTDNCEELLNMNICDK